MFLCFLPIPSSNGNGLFQVNSVGLSDSNASFRRKLSKREKKALKKQEKKAALKSENGDVKDSSDSVAEKLYTGEVLGMK